MCFAEFSLKVKYEVVMSSECQKIEDHIKAILSLSPPVNSSISRPPLIPNTLHNDSHFPSAENYASVPILPNFPYNVNHASDCDIITATTGSKSELIDSIALTKFVNEQLKNDPTPKEFALFPGSSTEPTFLNAVWSTNHQSNAFLHSKDQSSNILLHNGNNLSHEPIPNDFQAETLAKQPEIVLGNPDAQNYFKLGPSKHKTKEKKLKSKKKKDIKKQEDLKEEDERVKGKKNSKKERKTKSRELKSFSTDFESHPSPNLPLLDTKILTNETRDREKSRSKTSSKTTKPQQSNSKVSIQYKESPFIPSILKEYSIVHNSQGNFVFLCDLCDYNTNDQLAMKRHVNSTNHDKSVKHRENRLCLMHLPEPLEVQTKCVEEAIYSSYKKFGICSTSKENRMAVVSKVNELLQKDYPDCSIEMVGSSATGFGLESSNLDMVLKVPTEMNAADMLSNTFKLLQEDLMSNDVRSIFREKVPRIQFQHESLPKRPCNITLDAGHVVHLTKLVSMYSCLDDRVIPLGTAFRNWASLCEIDEVDVGTLPSFCYVLLFIYFLQQTVPPVLPVLDSSIDYLNSVKLESFKDDFEWKTENKDSIGLLWIKLFKFYSLQYVPGHDVISIKKEKVSCSDKNWGTKFLAIEDPFVGRNLAHTIPNKRVFNYIQECFVRTYTYFAFPQLQNRKVDIRWCDEPLSSTEVDIPSHSSLLSEGTLSEAVKPIDEYLEDHDPDLPFEDVLSTLSKLKLSSDNDSEGIDENDAALIPPANLEEDSSAKPRERTHTESITSDSSDVFVDSVGFNTAEGNSEKLDTDLNPPETDVASSVETVKNLNDDDVLIKNVIEKVLSGSEAGKLGWNLDKFEEEEVQYSFKRGILRPSVSLPLYCRLCQQTGHVQTHCPEEELPPITKLPPMREDFLNCLNDVCFRITNEFRPSPLAFKERRSDCSIFEGFIRKVYPNADLQLFGSFENGFGFFNSDMDFCLTFKNDDGKELDHAEIIMVLADHLKTKNRAKNVQAIISAKVPIVKFYDSYSKLECDISLYNILALENTKLLKAYCNIDSRVQVLGYVLKFFAKKLGICDASRGSLSSYAYVLMVLFYLQQRKPPVIPVLQELYQGDKPKKMVDDCNTWFYDDIKHLDKVWPEHGKNKESVGQLWLGLLSFYVSEFNFQDHVICIRQKEPLSRFQKLWNTTQIAIEDPFDLSHNLGSGLSRKMNCYILKTFIRGREHFGTPINMDYFVRDPVKYLFDANRLTNGYNPPNDRGCKRCGRIGHIARNCPLNDRPKSSNNAQKRNLPKAQVTPEKNMLKEKQDFKRDPRSPPKPKLNLERLPQSSISLPPNSSASNVNKQIHGLIQQQDNVSRPPVVVPQPAFQTRFPPFPNLTAAQLSVLNGRSQIPMRPQPPPFASMGVHEAARPSPFSNQNNVHNNNGYPLIPPAFRNPNNVRAGGFAQYPPQMQQQNMQYPMMPSQQRTQYTYQQSQQQQMAMMNQQSQQQNHRAFVNTMGQQQVMAHGSAAMSNQIPQNFLPPNNYRQ